MEAKNPDVSPARPEAPATDELSRHLEQIQFPLTLSFKILALATQVTVTDAEGRGLLYIKQKMFKLREHIEVWTDASRGTQLADIKANKVLDWSARYHATDAAGEPIGSVGRRGWRSIWRANYEAFNPGDDQPDFSISEENAWVKVLDSLVDGIPFVGMFSGYFLHPSYIATRSDGRPAMRMTKQAAFFEGRFKLEALGEMTPREELNLILSFLMLVILERKRG